MLKIIAGIVVLYFIVAFSFNLPIPMIDRPVPQGQGSAPRTEAVPTRGDAMKRDRPDQQESRAAGREATTGPSDTDRELIGTRRLQSSGGAEDLAFRSAAKEMEIRLRDEVAALTAKLTTVENDDAGHVEEVQKQLGLERTRVAAMSRDLADLRERLSNVTDQDQISARERSADITALKAKLAAADRDGFAQVNAVHQQLSLEQARSVSLRDQIASLRDGATSVAGQIGDFDVELYRLTRNQFRATIPTSCGQDLYADYTTVDAIGPIARGVVMPNRDFARRLPPIAPCLQPDGSALTNTQGNRLEASAPMASPSRPAGKGEPTALASSHEPVRAVDVLPPGMTARVTLVYAKGSESAHQRASLVKTALEGRGMPSAEPVEARTNLSSSSVTYFYVDDKVNADRVSDIVAIRNLVRARLVAGSPMPRPGAIEVSMAP